MSKKAGEESGLTNDHINDRFFASKESEILSSSIAQNVSDIIMKKQKLLIDTNTKDIQYQNYAISDEKNNTKTDQSLDIGDNLTQFNSICQENENDEEFGISSSDESISDDDANSNEIYIPNYFFDTIHKTAEKQLSQKENTESISNSTNISTDSSNYKIEQTQSNSYSEIKTRNIQIGPKSNFHIPQEKDNNEKSNRINKQKIEEIKENCFNNFEKVTKDELKIIEESKSDIIILLENITNEALTKLKDPQTLTLPDIEKIIKNALISIENAKNSILTKIQETKIDALNKIKNAKNEALSKIECIQKEGIEKFNAIENCEDFGISSSDNESSSDSYVENENDVVVVPKYIVDMIIENAKIQVDQEDKQNKKF